ncbi:hypothetical protein SBRY_20059 [Actinacidiphila bryophytorum]|uniref:Uncharacterized protein n=1 Tax=Actinacidiphila bryophytorum TaxID=1436133 RepID=A0A9W4E5R5_9ACTN|nr:hypothetical protein SBRY_20059 [Actinacidiphila bryophytorum]
MEAQHTALRFTLARHGGQLSANPPTPPGMGWMRPAHGGVSSNEAHRRRLLGVVPVRGLGLFELSRRGRRLPAADRHGQRSPGRTAAPRRALRPGRGRAEPSARRPLHRHVRLLRGPLLPARRRPRRRDPRVRPGRHRTPAQHRLRGRTRREVHERGLRLPHPAAGHLPARPLRHRHRPGQPPRRGLRLPARLPGPHPDLLRRHRPLPGTRHPRRRRRPLPVRGVLHRGQGGHPRAAPQRPRGRRGRRPRRRRPPGPHPHPPVDQPLGQPPRRPGRLRRSGRPGDGGRGLRAVTAEGPGARALSRPGSRGRPAGRGLSE